jgi:hypothetical protein
MLVLAMSRTGMITANLAVPLELSVGCRADNISAPGERGHAGRDNERLKPCKIREKLVGVTGLEPATSSSRTLRKGRIE